MGSARDVPAHAEADDCTKPCLCHECADLDATRRAQASYWLSVRCSCFICRETLVA